MQEIRISKGDQVQLTVKDAAGQLSSIHLPSRAVGKLCSMLVKIQDLLVYEGSIWVDKGRVFSKESLEKEIK